MLSRIAAMRFHPVYLRGLRKNTTAEKHAVLTTSSSTNESNACQYIAWNSCQIWPITRSAPVRLFRPLRD
ncbi:hypothetical protein AHF37_07271 [Paragonimus kellicotti]|nr:hypothetical protein AHF37_07271 [Paragonimus kellicotti]